MMRYKQKALLKIAVRILTLMMKDDDECHKKIWVHVLVVLTIIVLVVHV